MVFIEILFGVIFVGFCWIVLVPVDIRVNTQTGRYELRQIGTLSISLHPAESRFVRMTLLGFSVPFGKRTGASERVEAKRTKVRRAKREKSVKAWMVLIRSIWKSFECKRFICDIDFDDVVLNAQLLPVARLVTHGPLVLNVNFQGRYLIDMWIRGKVYRVVWAGLRFLFTK